MDSLKPYLVPALIIVGAILVLKYVFKEASVANPSVTAAPGAGSGASATAAAGIPTGT